MLAVMLCGTKAQFLFALPAAQHSPFYYKTEVQAQRNMLISCHPRADAVRPLALFSADVLS